VSGRRYEILLNNRFTPDVPKRPPYIISRKHRLISTITMRLFLAGIMQGSHRGEVLHDQGYRRRLRRLLAEHLPEAKVYDPLADHQDSVAYGDEKARRVFMAHNQMCGQVDVVLAFVPEASMGTAIEMWEARRHGRIVATVSPLKHNWAVRLLSHLLFDDIDQFEQALVSGAFARNVRQLQSHRP
jgi:hypothetical protein